MSNTNNHEILVSHTPSYCVDQRSYTLKTDGLIKGEGVLLKNSKSVVELVDAGSDTERMSNLGRGILSVSGIEYVKIKDNEIIVGKNYFKASEEDVRWEVINSAVLTKILEFVKLTLGQESTFTVITEPSDLGERDSNNELDGFKFEVEEPEEPEEY